MIVSISNFISSDKTIHCVRDVDLAVQMHRQKFAEVTGANANALQAFDQFVDTLRNYYSKMDFTFPFFQLLEAIGFAAEKHQGQARKDAARTPYIVHPIGVAQSLWEEGEIQDPTVLIAALLHDTLEDTNATQQEITSLFGSEVYDIVLALTKPSGMPTEEAKQWQIDHAHSLSPDARLIKLADRLYNIRDMQNAKGWSEDKVRSYCGWGQKLLDVLRGTNLPLEERLQEAINATKPRSRL